MDSKETILYNLRKIAGCESIRDFNHLGPMKLKTLRKRMDPVDNKLSRSSIISIYIKWLQWHAKDRAFPKLPIAEWCRTLFERGCQADDLTRLWRLSWNPHTTNTQKDQKENELMKDIYAEIKKFSGGCRRSSDKKPKRDGAASNSHPSESSASHKDDCRPPPIAPQANMEAGIHRYVPSSDMGTSNMVCLTLDKNWDPALGLVTAELDSTGLVVSGPLKLIGNYFCRRCLIAGECLGNSILDLALIDSA